MTGCPLKLSFRERKMGPCHVPEASGSGTFLWCGPGTRPSARSRQRDRPTHRPGPGPPLAATTLLAAGLLVSILDFVELPLLAGAVFLLTRDFFFIANVVSPVYLTALR